MRLVSRRTRLGGRISSAAEQRVCQPEGGGSIPSSGTSQFNDLQARLAKSAEERPRARIRLLELGLSLRQDSSGTLKVSEGTIPWTSMNPFRCAVPGAN